MSHQLAARDYKKRVLEYMLRRDVKKFCPSFSANCIEMATLDRVVMRIAGEKLFDDSKPTFFQFHIRTMAMLLSGAALSIAQDAPENHHFETHPRMDPSCTDILLFDVVVKPNAGVAHALFEVSTMRGEKWELILIGKMNGQNPAAPSTSSSAPPPSPPRRPSGTKRAAPPANVDSKRQAPPPKSVPTPSRLASALAKTSIAPPKSSDAAGSSTPAAAATSSSASGHPTSSGAPASSNPPPPAPSTFSAAPDSSTKSANPAKPTPSGAPKASSHPSSAAPSAPAPVVAAAPPTPRPPTDIRDIPVLLDWTPRFAHKFSFVNCGSRTPATHEHLSERLANIGVRPVRVEFRPLFFHPRPRYIFYFSVLTDDEVRKVEEKLYREENWTKMFHVSQLTKNAPFFSRSIRVGEVFQSMLLATRIHNPRRAAPNREDVIWSVEEIRASLENANVMEKVERNLNVDGFSMLQGFRRHLPSN